jgi:hypothetical protein
MSAKREHCPYINYNSFIELNEDKRMNRKLFALLLLTFLFLLPTSALACACCAEPGVWHEYNGALEEYEVGVLQEIRMGRRADLYETAAGLEEDAKGIEVADYNYTFSFLPSNKQLELTFRNAKGRTGKLTLIVPKTYTDFKVDMQEQKNVPNGPVLYKEWRLAGDIKGTGIFAKGLAEGGTYHLVLQARGNGCDSADQFRHWVLQVRGPKAYYAFYGDMMGARRGR